ncbi:secretin N-terminal domain-containing protein [Poriferisphaera sp. WC338]|uniref:secretin N-terminal domain-containing protein n=1 Tax=Poriferisphaera sp. WC338 TaxID=3425129 RepID=UPI003D8189D2
MPIFGQDNSREAAVAQTQTQDYVELNLAPNVELKVLTDYVTRQLGINVIYDEAIGGKRITLNMPKRIPKQSLLPILESALKMKGLLLVDDQVGWKRVVHAKSLSSNTTSISERGGEAILDKNRQGDEVVTWFVTLHHVHVNQAQSVVQPFLSQSMGSSGNVIVVPSQNALIVTDYKSQMSKIEEVLVLFDRPGELMKIAFMRLKYHDPSQLSQMIIQLVQQRYKLSGNVGSSGGSGVVPIFIAPDSRTNQLIVIADDRAMACAKEILAALDVAVSRKLVVYPLQYVKVDRMEQIASEMMDLRAGGKSGFKIIRDDDSASLLVIGTTAEHERLQELVEQFDVKTIQEQRVIKKYKLKHTDAEEVLATIRALDQEILQEVVVSSNGVPSDITLLDERQSSRATTNQPEPVGAQTENISITADKNTNSILLMGPKSVQDIYRQLIEMLDVRRPQVLIECTIVTIDHKNDLSHGVEVGGEINMGSDVKARLFSSFGLSSTDSSTGAKSLGSSPGFNGTVFKTDVADIIIKALKTNGRGRVFAMPRLLVNDNATGRIESISEAPFTSVNASDTVSTTSFGGFVSAGTQVSMKPHIAEGDHLRLEYEVTLNSFSGEGSNGIPPPRQTNSISSEVTVPNGYTIIVGGMRREDESDTTQAVPILGELPILDYLFGSKEIKSSDSIMYIFIRPYILREDNFSDLRYFSNAGLETTGLDQDYPTSQPVLMK